MAPPNPEDEEYGPVDSALDLFLNLKDKASPEVKKAAQTIGGEMDRLRKKVGEFEEEYNKRQKKIGQVSEESAAKVLAAYHTVDEQLEDVAENYDKIYAKNLFSLGSIVGSSKQITTIVQKWAKDHNVAVESAYPIVAKVLSDRDVADMRKRADEVKRINQDLSNKLGKTVGLAGTEGASGAAYGKGGGGVGGFFKRMLGGGAGGGGGFSISGIIGKIGGMSGSRLAEMLLGFEATKAAIQWDTSMTKIRRSVGMTNEEYKEFYKTSNRAALDTNLMPDEMNLVAQAWSKIGKSFGDDYQSLKVLATGFETLHDGIGLSADEAKDLTQDFAQFFGKDAKDFKEFGKTMEVISRTTTLTHGEMLGVYTAAKPFARLVKELGGDSNEVEKNFAKTADELKQAGAENIFGEFKLGEDQTGVASGLIGVSQQQLIEHQLAGKGGEDVKKLGEVIVERLGLKQGMKQEDIAHVVAGMRGYAMTQMLKISNTDLMNLANLGLHGARTVRGEKPEALEARVKKEQEDREKAGQPSGYRSLAEQVEHIGGTFDELSTQALGSAITELSDWGEELNMGTKKITSFEDAIDEFIKKLTGVELGGGAATGIMGLLAGNALLGGVPGNIFGGAVKGAGKLAMGGLGGIATGAKAVGGEAGTLLSEAGAPALLSTIATYVIPAALAGAAGWMIGKGIDLLIDKMGFKKEKDKFFDKAADVLGVGAEGAKGAEVGDVGGGLTPEVAARRRKRIKEHGGSTNALGQYVPPATGASAALPTGGTFAGTVGGYDPDGIAAEAEKFTGPLSGASDLQRLAAARGFHVTDVNTPGVHSPNSLHYKGLAIDVRTRDKKPEEIAAFVAEAQKLGVHVLDEGQHPSEKSSGPHLHLSTPPAGSGREVGGPGFMPAGRQVGESKDKPVYVYNDPVIAAIRDQTDQLARLLRLKKSDDAPDIYQNIRNRLAMG